MDDTRAIEPIREPLPEQLPTTMKQLHFAKAYVECGNVVEAARRAGYRGDNQILAAIGTKLLNQEDVRGLIRRHLKSVISPQEVASIISDIARGSVEHFLARDEHGNLRTNEKGLYEWDLSTAEAQSNMHLIRSMRPTRYGMAIELHDKIAALALIAKLVKVEDQRAMARRAMEYVLDALPPQLRGQVIVAMNQETPDDLTTPESSPGPPSSASSEAPPLAWLEEMKSSAVGAFEEESEEESDA